ncbi:LacI family DNA-binding transcriptional regulator [Streptomyces sp. NPDC006711]|uniref:LacI family DNA-binding transcriptional regulator n=1 Tax=unclassified Streptomyces TaxID=2593676 RepID=UPI0036737BDC
MTEWYFGIRPTLDAVAAHAGVSRATASRVVNGGTGVRPHLVEKVRQAVEELRYIPNPAARSLVTRRTGAVAVIVAEPETRFFSDPFFSQQIRGIGKELSAHDTQLVLLLVEDADDYGRVSRYLAGGHVDGALAFSLHEEDPLPAITRGAGVLTVFGGRPGFPTSVPYVDADNRGGAREAVRHLLAIGRKRIAHIAGPLDQTASTDRLAGYRDVLPEADPALVAEGAFTSESGAEAMSQLLARRPDLDAVFAGNDLMASGALRVLRDSGRRVPEDVALVGFDDMASVAEATDPPLTTVRQEIEEMGRLMARLLLRGLDQGGAVVAPPASVITPTALVRRASA